MMDTHNLHSLGHYTCCLLPDTADIAMALKHINMLKGVPLTLFITDPSGKMSGTLTDGDIRRGLLGGYTLSDPVTNIMQRHFRYLSDGADNLGAFRSARELGIELLPVLDKDKHIIGTADLRHQSSMLPLDAVLMAGGRGERLRPLTVTTPKPLLPVGGKPIIDYNIESLSAYGICDIFVTVNYLREQIIEHCSRYHGTARVKCVPEDRPLGTFGSIGLIKDLKHDNVLVMNSDLLTTLNFEKMYEHHISSQAALTMAVVPYTVSVPYAILRTEQDRVLGFEEKPTYNYFANAGVYILHRHLLKDIDGSTRIDATDFIDTLLSQGLKVGYFPIDGTWIDIGSPDDYNMACKKMAP